MNAKLKAGLKVMDDSDYFELCLAKQAGSLIREMIKEYGLSETEVAKRLKVTAKKFHAMKNFYDDFNLRDISKIQSLYNLLFYERNKEETEKKLKEKEIWKLANHNWEKENDTAHATIMQLQKEIEELKQKTAK